MHNVARKQNITIIDRISLFAMSRKREFFDAFSVQFQSKLWFIRLDGVLVVLIIFYQWKVADMTNHPLGH